MISTLDPEALKALRTRLDRRLATTRLLDYTPYPKQLDYHAAGAKFRERLLMAANQTGKTWSAGFEHAMHLTGRYPSWWTGRTFQKPPLIWVASETSEITRDGVQRILLGRLQDGVEHALGTGAIPRDAIVDWKRKPHGVADAVEFAIVRHGGGGDVQAGQSYVGFKSYDQGRTKFQAETLDAVWLDEEPDSDIYFECMTRTNVRMGMISLTFTPLKGMSAVVMRYLMEKPSSAHVTRMGLVDALHYTPEQREAIIASYPAHERKARAYGEPTLGSGAVFTIEPAAVTVPTAPIPPWWHCIGGIDFGWDHPTAGAFCAHDAENDVFYVCRTLRARQTTPTSFAAAVRPWGERAGKQWLPWAWPHDGRQGGGKFDVKEQKQLQQLYADQGLLMLAEHATFENGSNGVEPGVQDMLDRMQTGRFRVFDCCTDFLEEMALYHRKDGLIQKVNDDCISAVRYAFMMRRHAMTPPRPPAAVKRASAGRNWRTV